MKNSESLLPAERQEKILEILSQKFTARSSTLSEIFGVSTMMIRRDFNTLEQPGPMESYRRGRWVVRTAMFFQRRGIDLQVRIFALCTAKSRSMAREIMR